MKTEQEPRAVLYIFLAAICATMTSCAVGTEGSTGTSTMQPARNAVSSSTPAASSTFEPAATLLLPTPVLPESNEREFFLADFFFGSPDPSCQLPCWRGLIVGESNTDDIQSMFDMVFGFSGHLDFFPDSYPDDSLDGIYGGDIEIADLSVSGYRWATDDSLNHTFSATVYFHDGSEKYQALSFSWFTTNTDDYRIHMSPQAVLAEVDAPSQMLVNAVMASRPDLGRIYLVMIYEEGLIFKFDGFFPIEITYTDDSKRRIESAIGEFCLGNEELQQDMGSSMGGEIILLEPFRNGLNSLSPLQEKFVGTSLNSPDYPPIQDVFGLTPEEVTQMALRDQDACLFTGNLWDRGTDASP